MPFSSSSTSTLIAPEIVTLTNFIMPTPTTVDLVVEPYFNLPRPSEVRRDGPFLGWVKKHGNNLYGVHLSLEDLNTHIAIFGMTGSGKSTTASVILSRLVELGIKVLVIDWHNEYRNIVSHKNGLVFTPGKDVAPLTVNPLDPSLSGDLSEHMSLVTDIFTDIFNFTPPQGYMFREALRSTYRRCGYFSEKPSLPPIVSDIVQEIERAPIRSAYDNETKLALLRRLKPLTEGQAGKALNGQTTIPIEDILSDIVSVELGHFKEQEIRKIFTSIFLKLLYDYRTKEKFSKLQHVTIIEEARNIIPARRPEDPPSIGEKMISELRKFGEGLVIISQFPTQVSYEILKNAATRICHQIKTEDDRKILQGAMKLTERQASYLHYLKLGEAIVNMPLIPYAFPIYVETESSILSQLSDDQLKNTMQKRFYEYHIEIAEKPSQPPMAKLIMQTKLYQLFKEYGSLTDDEIKTVVSTSEFYPIAVPILNELSEKGIIKKELDEKTGQTRYTLIQTHLDEAQNTS
mgnify:CR=1 FL=1